MARQVLLALPRVRELVSVLLLPEQESELEPGLELPLELGLSELEPLPLGLGR